MSTFVGACSSSKVGRDRKGLRTTALDRLVEEVNSVLVSTTLHYRRLDDVCSGEVKPLNNFYSPLQNNS